MLGWIKIWDELHLLAARDLVVEVEHVKPLLRKVCGPIKVNVDNKGTIDGLRKGEKECIKPRAGDADQ